MKTEIAIMMRPCFSFCFEERPYTERSWQRKRGKRRQEGFVLSFFLFLAFPTSKQYPHRVPVLGAKRSLIMFFVHIDKEPPLPLDTS